MSEQSVDILIIGDGVSARAIQWKLFLSSFSGSVLQVYSEDLFPMTSVKSTGLVAYRGMQKGISPLGDVLLEGVEYFFKNIMDTGLMGLERGTLIDICPIDDGRIQRRYGRSDKLENYKMDMDLNGAGYCYAKEDVIFVNPSLFMDSLLNQYDYKSKTGTLVNIADNVATFIDGKKIKFNKIVLACGVGLAHLPALGIAEERNITEVPGSFYQWNIDLDHESFAIGLGKCNLIYRNSDNVLMLGGTTQNDEIISHDGEALNTIYNEAKKVTGSWLPAKSEANIYSGVRVKGPRRMPLFEEIQKDVFILGSAYKNGWSQSFYGSSKLIDKLL